jgi:hypothetical protein
MGRWWTGEDSNLRSPQGAADLQSAGFSHSPTRPANPSGTQRSDSTKPPRTEPDCCSGYLVMQKGLVSKDTSPNVFVARNPSVSVPTKIPVPQNLSWRRDLNPRPSDYKSDALPTELRQHSANRAKLSQRQSNCKQIPQPGKALANTSPISFLPLRPLLYSGLGKLAIVENDVVVRLVDLDHQSRVTAGLLNDKQQIDSVHVAMIIVPVDTREVSFCRAARAPVAST